MYTVILRWASAFAAISFRWNKGFIGIAVSEAAIENKQIDIEAGVTTEEHDVDSLSSGVSTSAHVK